jgi:hypothetical protein
MYQDIAQAVTNQEMVNAKIPVRIVKRTQYGFILILRMQCVVKEQIKILPKYK